MSKKTFFQMTKVFKLCTINKHFVTGPHGSFVSRGQVMKPPSSNLDLEHANGAYWMRLTRGDNGTSAVAPVDLGDAVPTSKDLSVFPSVEDTIDVAREDAEANVPTAVTTLREPGAVEQSRHELTHMPHVSWCFSCVAGRGADEPHRKSHGHSGPTCESRASREPWVHHL